MVKPMLIYVKTMKVMGPHSLDLLFNDGTRKRVNLRRFLWGELFEPLRDPEFFAKAQLDEWTVSWPNGADFAPEFLYELEPELELAAND
jgi:hypothetical protein